MWQFFYVKTLIQIFYACVYKAWISSRHSFDRVIKKQHANNNYVNNPKLRCFCILLSKIHYGFNNVVNIVHQPWIQSIHIMSYPKVVTINGRIIRHLMKEFKKCITLKLVISFLAKENSYNETKPTHPYYITPRL